MKKKIVGWLVVGVVMGSTVLAQGGQSGRENPPTTQKPATKAPQVVESYPGRVIVTPTTAPIFVMPETTKAPLRLAKEGSVLNVIGSEGEWYRIEFEDPQWGQRLGYVEKRHVHEQVAAPQEAVDVSVGSDSSAIPRLWLSLASGTTKVVRIYGAFLYIETVVPPPSSGARRFILAELQTTDGGTYVGTIRDKLTYLGKSCSYESPIYVTLLTPSRIEGWTMDYPDGDRFDWGRCKHSKPVVKQTFTWIPR